MTTFFLLLGVTVMFIALCVALAVITTKPPIQF